VKTEFEIAVLAGDGIGPEIMQPCLTVLAGLSGFQDGVA